MTRKSSAPGGATPKERNSKNMFGKRRTPELGDRSGAADDAMESEGVAIPAARPAARPAPKQPARAASQAARPPVASPQEPMRRPADAMPPAGRRIEPTPPPEQSANEGRKLVVGQDISLSGEIKSCQKLVVEGQVESNMTECSVLQISATGLYKGSAAVDHADISGRFDGDLTVHGQLTLRSTGRLVGSLRYAQMEIERGGRISGTMEEIEPSVSAVAGTSGASAMQAEVESRLGRGPAGRRRRGRGRDRLSPIGISSGDEPPRKARPDFGGRIAGRRSCCPACRVRHTTDCIEQPGDRAGPCASPRAAPVPGGRAARAGHRRQPRPAARLGQP